MMSSGGRFAFSRRSRISCGFASWIASQGTNHFFVFCTMCSRFIFSACRKRAYGSLIGERVAT